MRSIFTIGGLLGLMQEFWIQDSGGGYYNSLQVCPEFFLKKNLRTDFQG